MNNELVAVIIPGDVDSAWVTWMTQLGLPVDQFDGCVVALWRDTVDRRITYWWGPKDNESSPVKGGFTKGGFIQLEGPPPPYPMSQGDPPC